MSDSTDDQAATNVPADLRAAAERVRGGTNSTTSVRTLISWFGQKRRGSTVNATIRSTLTALQVTTHPAFEDEWIDASIEFRPLDGHTTSPGSKTSTAAAAPAASAGASAQSGEQSPVEQLLPGAEPAVKVSHLPAANKAPRRIAKEKSLAEATTIMLAYDYSQLPVMNNERDVFGMVSWKSIGRAHALGKNPKTVLDATDQFVRIVRRSDSFYGAVQEVVAHDVVLVRSDEDRKICGILTAADVSSHFRTLAEPFLLLGEIERSIRKIIAKSFDVSALAAVRDPGDTKREIASVDDLAFGEYVRLLEEPSRWSKLNTTLDRGVVIDRLKTINKLRNEVMHFDPDDTAPEDVDTIRRVAEFFLRWVDELEV